MRVGVVPYLNAVPLVAELGGDVEIRPGVPAELSEWLAEGRVDAALLPVAEAARGVGDGFIGKHGIAADGPVTSVLWFLQEGGRAGEPATWPDRVALDPASRTSVALTRVLLERRFGKRPTYETARRAGPDPRRSQGAITLVIGDAALAHRRGWPHGIVDLAEAWREWTGLPFVFARWTARRGLEAQARAELERVLGRAAEAGLARREALARAAGPRHGVDPDDAVAYLTDAIRYEVGPREERGHARFVAELAALDADEPVRHAGPARAGRPRE